MKKFRRMMALLLAMVMTLSMGTSVFAEQAKAKIKFPTAAEWASHTYEIYQIYVGDVDTTKDQGLTNLKYGVNHATGTPGSGVSQTEITALQNITANARGTADLADLLAMGGYVDLTKDPYKTLTKTEGEVEVETGYYLIKDVDGSQNGETKATDAKAYTLYILEVLDQEVTISPKASVPSDDKKVADINDSTDTAMGAYGTDADYDIGDDVPFQLTATTASNVSQYKNYHITFQDEYCEGLDAPEKFTVDVLGKTFYMDKDGKFYTDDTFTTENAALATQTTTNNTKITVSKATATASRGFALKVAFVNSGYKADGTAAEKALGIPTEADSATITVTYTAVLNNSANVGAAGNPNKSHIEYSNNPNSSDDSDEGTTPDKEVIVFTYKIDVDKVDQDYGTLTGAGFALIKEVKTVPAGTTPTAVAAYSTPAAWRTAWDALADGAYITYNSKNYVVVKNWGENATGYNFEYEGIDDGNYVLVETVVPTGYNKTEDVSFTVQADHSEKMLNSLSAGSSFNSTLAGGELEFKKANDSSKTHKVNTGTDKAAVATVVVNQSGATLPETGGVGTTIFYILGAILVIGAGIILVTRRRMSAN